MDSITLTGITAFGYHGVFDHEQRDGQEFIVDIVLDADLPTKSDDLAHTVNYAGVVQMAADVVVNTRFDLIETLAGEIATRCLSLDLVQQVAVTVHKPNAPLQQQVRDVSVTIRRSRDV